MASSFNEKGAIAQNWVIVNEDSTSEPQNIINIEETLKEFFVQYYFQCVLSSDIVELKEKFEILLLESYRSSKYSDIDFLSYVIKICLQNRDIKYGKGLVLTTHMMLNAITYYCYEKCFFPKETLIKILKSFVQNKYNKTTNKNEHPYGSWKDIKYFLDYFLNDINYKYNNVSKNMIVDEVIKEVYIPQMIQDRKNMSIQQPISLCGKWLPRESGQFKYLAKKIAIHYHNEVYRITENNNQIYKNYRKLISKYNKYLDTTQIHMTQKTWDKINFETVTSKTLFINKESFFYNKNINV